MTPLHPMIVHFPIVLLLAAAGLYLAGWLRKLPQVEFIGFVFHALGVLACIVALLTGDIEADRVDALAESVVSQHEFIGTVSTYAFGILAIWAFLRQKSNLFAEKLAFVVLYLGLYGFMAFGANLGGELVYQYGKGVSMPSERDDLDSVSGHPSSNPIPQENE